MLLSSCFFLVFLKGCLHIIRLCELALLSLRADLEVNEHAVPPCRGRTCAYLFPYELMDLSFQPVKRKKFENSFQKSEALS